MIWQLMAVENPILFFCPGLFVVALMAVFTFCKFTVWVKFASVYPLDLFILLTRRFNYINTANSYDLIFLINWSSRFLKEKINFFLKPDCDQQAIHQGYEPLVPHPYFLL